MNKRVSFRVCAVNALGESAYTEPSSIEVVSFPASSNIDLSEVPPTIWSYAVCVSAIVWAYGICVSATASSYLLLKGPMQFVNLLVNSRMESVYQLLYGRVNSQHRSTDSVWHYQIEVEDAIGQYSILLRVYSYHIFWYSRTSSYA